MNSTSSVARDQKAIGRVVDVGLVRADGRRLRSQAAHYSRGGARVSAELLAHVTQELEATGELADQDGEEARRRRSDGCLAARAAYADALTNKKRWDLLLLLVGVAVAITLAILLIQLPDLDTDTAKVTAAAAAAGTAVEAGAAIWLVKRRNESRTDVRSWASLIDRRCR